MARPITSEKPLHEPHAEEASPCSAAIAPGIAPGVTAGVTAVPPGFVTRFWAWIVLLFLGVAWGLSFSLAKIAATGGAHPLGITFWQSAIGAGLLLVFSILLRRPISRKPRVVQIYVICGLLGSVIPGILFFYAASRVSAGVLSITITVVPILTFLLSALFGLERFAAGRVMGVLCGALAVLLLVAPEQSPSDPSATLWILAACAASACYAAENLVLAMRMPDDANPFMVTCGMFFAATMILTPIVIATGSFVPLPWPWGPVEWSIAGMAAVSTIAYGLYVYLIHHAGPVFASQTAYAVTLSGVIWGMVIFGEEHSPWIWLSLALMMAGLALVTPRRSGRKIS